MKRLLFIIFVFAALFAACSNPQPGKSQMKGAKMKARAVFMGNSITEVWMGVHPDFFTANNYINKGISGQTTPQFVNRFRKDVIDLSPEVVVINGGINDISELFEEYNAGYTFGCIREMAEMADSAGIKVILTSVLPVSHIPWNKNITDAPEKISQLNKAIHTYALEKGFGYADYYSQMVNEQGGIIESYTSDGVHVTAPGYDVMEPVIKNEIDCILGK